MRTGGLPFCSCSKNMFPRLRMTSQKRTVRCAASVQYSHAACHGVTARSGGIAHLLDTEFTEIRGASSGRSSGPADRMALPKTSAFPTMEHRHEGGCDAQRHRALDHEGSATPARGPPTGSASAEHE